jgi:hypothetical protein
VLAVLPLLVGVRDHVAGTALVVAFTGFLVAAARHVLVRGPPARYVDALGAAVRAWGARLLGAAAIAGAFLLGRSHRGDGAVRGRPCRHRVDAPRHRVGAPRGYRTAAAEIERGGDRTLPTSTFRRAPLLPFVRTGSS